MPREVKDFARRTVGRSYVVGVETVHPLRWKLACLDCGDERLVAHRSLMALVYRVRELGQRGACASCGAAAREAGPAGLRRDERNARIAARHAEGASLVAIGREFGITKQRVGQILKAAGRSNSEGHHGVDRRATVEVATAAAQAAAS